MPQVPLFFKKATNMRKSIIVHLDSLEVLSELTNEQAGILFKAIKSYANGIEPELDFSMKLAFLPFRNQFIRDSEKYEKTCEVRRLAGSIGGKKKVANASKSKQKVANLADSDSKSKNDSKKDSDNKNDNYGVNENIILSITDYEKLKVDFGEQKTKQAIDYLSNWGLEKPSKFKEYKNHNLALRRWVFDAIEKKPIFVDPKKLEADKYIEGRKEAILRGMYEQKDLDLWIKNNYIW